MARTKKNVRRTLKDYFEDDESGKQLEPLPTQWMDASRFKVGDKIKYLESCIVLVDEQRLNLKGQIGTVVKLNNGYGQFPPRWVGGDYQFYDGQHEGWLTVKFPFDYYGKEADGTYKPRACSLSDEGIVWKKTKEACQ